MTINRRSVLKGMALSSIAGLTIAGPLRAMAKPVSAVGQPVLVLTQEGAAGTVFLQGALTVVPQLQVQPAGADVDFLLALERQLRTAASPRIIGLLDDASATLVVDIARSAGARVQWLGHHSAEATGSRHHLLTANVDDYWAQQLGHQLQEDGSPFTLQVERQDGSLVLSQLNASPHLSGQATPWASSIGYLLASLGDAGLGGTEHAKVALSPVTSAPITGNFVSFSIEA